MPHYQLLFPSEYLRACDLQDKESIVEIETIKMDNLQVEKGKPQKKAVVTFKGKKKKWVMNKTNAKRIAKMLGENNTDKWVGKKIRLYPTTCESFGETVDCIRVKQTPVWKDGERSEH